MRTAGLLRRGVAFPIDKLVLALLWALGWAWLVLVYGATARYPWAIAALLLALIAGVALAVILSAVYSVGFVGGCGQTPAMMLLGMRVVRRDGARAGFVRAFVRWVAFALVLVTLGLGLLIALFDRERRAAHDWISGTRVVRV